MVPRGHKSAGGAPVDALVTFDEVFSGEDLLEVGAEGIGEGLFVDDAAAIEAFVLLFGEILADAGGRLTPCRSIMVRNCLYSLG